MPDTIRDGTGSGNLQKVDSDNRAWVRSKSISLQHSISEERQDAYQAPVATTDLASGTVVSLHLKNTDERKNLVITYIRHQVIGSSGGTDFPNVGNYFYMATGRTYVSGGTEEVAVNMFVGAGKEPSVSIKRVH